MGMETPIKHYDPVFEMEQLFFQLETNSTSSSSMLKEYQEKISTQTLVIKTLEQKLTKLEAETKSNNRMLVGQKAEIEKYHVAIGQLNQRLADLQSEIKSPMDYTAKIRSRQSSIARLEEKLARLQEQSTCQSQIFPFRSFRDLRISRLSKRIAEHQKYLQADINSNAEREKPAKECREQTALIKDLEAKLARLDADTKSRNINMEERLAKLELEGESKMKMIRASQGKIGQHENTTKQLRKSIADLKLLIEETSANNSSVEGLHLKLQSYLAKQEENEKLLDSYKVQLKERNDQINLLELKRTKKQRRR
ncbi:uncharacterized protein LOC6595798 [Drosophila persimilis]|nr:uncharacterized protein LOC6595798 [Drosophila persimilis]